MYLRNFSFQVGANGSGLELSPDPSTMPKATFHTYQHNKETPNHAQIRIYNLSTDTVKQIAQEFTQVVLQAGYIDSPYGQIFNGNIVQVKVGYENMGSIDSYIEIIAADGDLGYARAIAAFTMNKGSTYMDRFNALVKAANNVQAGSTGSGGGLGGLSSPSIGGLPGGTNLSNFVQGGTQTLSVGHVDQLPSGTLPRGRTYYGMWRDHMRDFAASTGTDWWVQDGKINVLGKSNTLPGQATVLTPQTGLIGWPEQTEQGIRIRSLLNPSLKPGGLLTIQGVAVLQTTLNTNFSGNEQNAQLPSINSNGEYKIIVVEHFGDTRGNDWYTEMICLDRANLFSPALSNAGYTL